MILEIIILIVLVGIFILLARRLPNVIGKSKVSVMPTNMANIPQENQKVDKKVEPISNESKDDLTLADDFFARADYKEAEKFYLDAAAKDPNNAKIYTRLGIIYLEQKNYRDARDAFSLALKLDDKKAARHVNFALANLQLKNYNEAIKSFEKALKLEPKNKKYQALLKEARGKKKLFEKK